MTSSDHFTEQVRKAFAADTNPSRPDRALAVVCILVGVVLAAIMLLVASLEPPATPPCVGSHSGEYRGEF
jgi:hypothetical protein